MATGWQNAIDEHFRGGRESGALHACLARLFDDDPVRVGEVRAWVARRVPESGGRARSLLDWIDDPAQPWHKTSPDRQPLGDAGLPTQPDEERLDGGAAVASPPVRRVAPARATQKATSPPRELLGRYELAPCERAEWPRHQAGTERASGEPVLVRWYERLQPIEREIFQSRYRTLAGLRHPGLVPLIDAVTADGRVGVVMPALAGRSLKDLRDESGEPIPDGQILDWIATLGDALETLHRHGIVHRDVKPANVWIDPSGEAKLIDLPVVPGGDGLTPAWAAPDAPGRSADRRDDVYGLAAVAWWLWTGTMPAAGQDEIAGLAPEHAKALRAALNPVRARRTPTVRAFLEALGAVEAAAPEPTIRAEPTLVGSRAAGARRPRRRRTRPAAWFVAGAFLALIGVFAAWYAGVLPGADTARELLADALEERLTMSPQLAAPVESPQSGTTDAPDPPPAPATDDVVWPDGLTVAQEPASPTESPSGSLSESLSGSLSGSSPESPPGSAAETEGAEPPVTSAARAERAGEAGTVGGEAERDPGRATQAGVADGARARSDPAAGAAEREVPSPAVTGPLRVVPDPLVVSESAGAILAYVEGALPEGTSGLQFVVEGGDAEPDADFAPLEAAPVTVDGETAPLVVVPLIDDTRRERTEIVQIGVYAWPGGERLLDIRATIVDDD